MKKLTLTLTTLGLAMTALMAPMSAMAANRDHGQSQKSQWQNIAAGSAAVGILGLLTHNNTIATAGLLGAGYSEYRADTDRNCNNDRHVVVRVDNRDRGRDRDRGNDHRNDRRR